MTQQGFKLYALVNYRTCGWCKKFKPVLESNLRAMNPKAQAKVEVVNLDSPEGKATAQKLGFSGGIPCLIGTKNGTEIYNAPGFQDGAKFANTLFTLFSTYV